MTKTENDVRGVRTTKRTDLPPIVPMPTTPGLGQMTRDQQIAWKKKYRAAEAAGEEARRKAMLAPGVEPTPENIEKSTKEEDKSEKESAIIDMREKLAGLQEVFDDNPKKPGLKAQITKLNKKIEAAEEKL